MQDFYDRVKTLIKQKNLFLIEFLQSLDIDYEKYKATKRINALPRADDVVKIALALNTTVEYLVTGNETSNSQANNELTRIKTAIRNLADSLDD